ncbi:uncharacterized protein [Penaeus vannamei]|uniref:uncharacterized protein n=1 Tax=Penaeus vannamei TaxID=6689 RepID=UPI000F67F15C|nr:uncharacterized protein LOC113815892 [Penaeus vannamei]
MEIEENIAHVNYKITIPKFSAYKDLNHTFTEVFPLSVNNLRFLWRLTIVPFIKESGETSRDDLINHDIGLSLECQKCNVNHPNLEVYCNVKGRDQHEKLLPRMDYNKMIWKDVLISRLALKVFNLLEDDKLVINLRFVVTGRDLKRAIDGVSEMSRDLSRLLESGAQSDIDLVTRDGVRLPVHSAILAVRSNLLQRAAKKGRVSAASTPRAQAETPPVKHVDTPINSTFGSMSSGYHSAASSPDAFASIASGPPPSAPVTTPMKALALHSPGPASPRSSPSSSKVSRRPPTPKRVALSQRPPTPRRNLSSRHLTPARSPSKRPLTPAAESPSKRTNVGRASIKFSEENKENKSLKIFHYRPRPSPSTCPGDSPGRATEAGEAPAGGKGPERLQVEVSMTASVATELLHWIYTGESDDLGALARPLLVAGIRHGMGGLTRACEDHLAAALTPASAPDVLYLAHKYGATSLREDALEYAVRKASEVTAQASWEALGERAPTLIMEFSRRLALHDHALTANA